MSDWIFNNFGWVLVAAIVVMGALFMAAEKSKSEAKQKFMDECLKERKQYECTAMWRAGQSQSGSTYVPIIIPMGTR